MFELIEKYIKIGSFLLPGVLIFVVIGYNAIYRPQKNSINFSLKDKIRTWVIYLVYAFTFLFTVYNTVMGNKTLSMIGFCMVFIILFAIIFLGALSNAMTNGPTTPKHLKEVKARVIGATQKQATNPITRQGVNKYSIIFEYSDNNETKTAETIL